MSEAAQFLRQPEPMTEWRTLVQVCEERHVNPMVVACPSKHREEAAVADRNKILRALKASGWPVSKLARVCPLSERRIREAVGT